MADVKITQLDAVTSLNGTDSFIVEQASAGTKRATQATLKTSIVGDTAIDGMGGTTVTGAIKYINDFITSFLETAVNTETRVGFHNSIARGKQLASIASCLDKIDDGTFTDMYIGDYWVVNNVTYRIAAFDWYYNRTGSSVHHVVVIPDTCIGGTVAMHSTATNEGGYIGSDMHGGTDGGTSGGTINTVRTEVKNRLGGDRIYQHNISLSNGVSSGSVTGITGNVSVDVTLPTVANIIGVPAEKKTVASQVPALTLDDQQFPLFRLMPEKQRILSTLAVSRYWTRDCLNAGFAMILSNGNAGFNPANNDSLAGIRPVFCIRKPAST